MKKLLLTITTLFLGLFTIASCDINPKPDKVKETETTQENENKENKTEDKVEDKDKENTEDKDKEKENKTEDKDKEKEPTTNDNGSTNSEQPSTDGTTSNGEQPSTDGTTSNGEQPSTSDNKQEEPSTSDNGTTSNDGTTSNEVGGSSESGSSESGITSDGRPTPEETARFLAFNTKRVEIKKRLREDSELNNSPEGIALARTIAPNWDMRYKTDLMGRPVDEFYLPVGSVERRKMKATSALNYGWEKINEERYTRYYGD